MSQTHKSQTHPRLQQHTSVAVTVAAVNQQGAPTLETLETVAIYEGVYSDKVTRLDRVRCATLLPPPRCGSRDRDESLAHDL